MRENMNLLIDSDLRTKIEECYRRQGYPKRNKSFSNFIEDIFYWYIQEMKASRE